MSQLVSARPDASGPEAEPVPGPRVLADDTPAPTTRSLSARATGARITPAMGVLGALSTALAACGGGSGGSSSAGSSSGGAVQSPPAPTAAITDAEAARFLLQAQFSASDADIAAVKSQGYAAWLMAQFGVAQSQTGTAWLDEHGHNIPDSAASTFNTSHGDWMAWRMLMTGEDQVRKRLALALSEMLVTSLDAMEGAWGPYLIAGYWDMLNANVFGNFRTLLEDITLNAAMGLYLATKGNLKEDVALGRQPDENFAREIMQLFTIGLYELNDDGTPKTDLFGNRTETYTQGDITNLARVFTGYNWDYSRVTYQTVSWSTQKVPTTEFTRDRMVVTASKHSNLAASFLGTTIPANTAAATALKTALDALFNHDNVGPFLARQMIQRLVTSNPSLAYVRRVARAFNDNGSGVRGDLKAVWVAVLTDTEALTLSLAASAGKVREPMVRLAQWARTFNATSTTGKWEIANLTAGSSFLGQSPLRSPSVFNYFRPGYVPPQTAMADQGLVAPEFQLHTETSTASYINFMTAAIRDGIKDVRPDYGALVAIADNARTLIDTLALRLTANQLSGATIAKIKSALEATAVTAASSDAVKLNRVQSAILLIMACPEYIIQK